MKDVIMSYFSFGGEGRAQDGMDRVGGGVGMWEGVRKDRGGEGRSGVGSGRTLQMIG